MSEIQLAEAPRDAEEAPRDAEERELLRVELEAALDDREIQHQLERNGIARDALSAKFDRSKALNSVFAERDLWVEARAATRQKIELPRSEADRSSGWEIIGFLAFLSFLAFALAGGLAWLMHRITQWSILDIDGKFLLLALASLFALSIVSYLLDDLVLERRRRRAVNAARGVLVERAKEACDNYRLAYREASKAQIRQAINEITAEYSDELRIYDTAGLNDIWNDKYRVETQAALRLSDLIRSLPGASIALAGGRGVGKTTLLRSLVEQATAKTPKDLAVMVSAPVEYAPLDFMLHLFQSVVREYLIYSNLPLPTEHLAATPAGQSVVPWPKKRTHYKRVGEAFSMHSAQQYWLDLRYASTYSSGLQGKVGVAGTEASVQAQVQAVRLPWSYPEAVDEFKRFLREASAAFRTKGSRLFILIDELDKIRSAARAQAFINELKAVFGVESIYFVVSVSEEALVNFDMGELGIRDAFDSAFDEMILVERLPLGSSRELLARRVIGLSAPFAAFAHCIAGGLPRDVIRTARRMATSPLPEGAPLKQVAQYIVADEILSKARALDGALGPGRRSLLASKIIHGSIAVASPLKFSAQAICEACRDFKNAAEETAPAERPSLIDSFIASLYFYLTVLQFFTTVVNPENLKLASGTSGVPLELDSLISAFEAVRDDPSRAHMIISEFREAWGLELLDPKA